MDPQNLLIIMSDEHNAGMMGGAGHKLARTPNLDQLALRGTRFANAYANCPICVPSRASLATGRFVHDIAYWDNSIAYDGRVKSWGHSLQEAGIPVESIGKLHYRNAKDATGFDVQHMPMHIANGMGMVHLSIRRQFKDFVRPKRSRAAIIEGAGPGESDYTRYDRKVADTAVAWLAAARERKTPWVLFVSFVTPHYPLIAPKEFCDLYPVEEMPDAKFGPGSGFVAHPWLADLVASSVMTREQQKVAFSAYLGLVSFMDAQVGRVLGALEGAGLADRTRVLYTSDHGENAGARGLWGKSNHYEEAARVPLILAGKDVAAGKVSHTTVSLVDVYPTVLESVGLPRTDETRPGRSLFALAAGPDDQERVAFSEYHAAGSPSASYMIRKGRFKLISYVGFAPELFDLAADPEERENLAARPDYGDILAELEALLRSYVDPEEADRRANDAQRRLIESLGGPEEVMAKLAMKKLYTPVPDSLGS
jgi:choline-sulfatase